MILCYNSIQSDTNDQEQEIASNDRKTALFHCLSTRVEKLQCDSFDLCRVRHTSIFPLILKT